MRTLPACLLPLALALACGGHGSHPAADLPGDALPDAVAEVPADAPALDITDAVAPADPGDDPGVPDAGADADLPGNTADTASDAAPDAAPADADAGDLPPADPGPEVEYPSERLAWAFLDNPDENGGEPSQVVLSRFTDPWGHLTGRFANVYNCLDQSGGTRFPMDTGTETVQVEFCDVRQTVVPGADGTYLHVRPPADYTDPDDAFAEVQMYHGLNVIHDYFHDVHGFTDNDRSLLALVNVQAHAVGDPWVPVDNAAFLPDGTMQQVGLDIGMTGDMMVFGQGATIDYSYEADVIHHEYTHSVVGSFRLISYNADAQGLDTSPLSMNEAVADYFPASLADNPILGGWALGDAARDLSQPRRCPDDLVGEAHADGQIFSSALWDFRGRVGAAIADDVVFQSLMKAGPNTSFTEMAGLLLETVDDAYPDLHATMADVVATHGLDGCVRQRAWADVAADAPGALVLEGRQSAGLHEFRQAVPGPVQFTYDVPEGAQSLTVEVQAASAGDGFGLGGTEDVRLRLSLHRGADPIQYAYFPSASNTAEATLDGTADGDVQRFVIAGSCLVPGPLDLQFLNRSYGAVVLRARSVTASADPYVGVATFDGCTDPAPGTAP